MKALSSVKTSTVVFAGAVAIVVALGVSQANAADAASTESADENASSGATPTLTADTDTEIPASGADESFDALSDATLTETQAESGEVETADEACLVEEAAVDGDAEYVEMRAEGEEAVEFVEPVDEQVDSEAEIAWEDAQ